MVAKVMMKFKIYVTRVRLVKTYLLILFLIGLNVSHSFADPRLEALNPAWKATFAPPKFVDMPHETRRIWLAALGQANVQMFKYIEARSTTYLIEDPYDLHADWHICQILAQHFGYDEISRSLTAFPDPDYHSGFDNAHIYNESALIISMRNWIIEVKRFVALKEWERLATWNLDCVGASNFSNIIPEEARINYTPPKNEWFKVDGNVLIVRTPILEGFFGEFINTLDLNPQIHYVGLGSGGGQIVEAIEAGLEIRRRGLSTVLYNNCLSACTIIFAGGVGRLVFNDDLELRVHQLTHGKERPPLTDLVYELIYRYMSLMGIDPDHYISRMVSSSSSETTPIHQAGICFAELANYVYGQCFGQSLSEYTGQPVPKITRMPVDLSLFELPVNVQKNKPIELPSVNDLIIEIDKSTTRELKVKELLDSCESMDHSTSSPDENCVYINMRSLPLTNLNNEKQTLVRREENLQFIILPTEEIVKP